MVTAAPQDQWRLLDVQDHDTKLAQLAHRRAGLPEHVEVDQVSRRLKAVADELITARTVESDITRELKKAEGDVELVRTRAARNQSRLDSGQGTVKDLQALQHDIESLAQRQSVLEDIELEVMERLEAAQAGVAAVTADQARFEVELADAVKRRDAALAAIDDEVSGVQRARVNAAAGLPADLLALYEKVCESGGGIGAARIRSRRCEGCRIELNPTDLNRIRSAAENEVVRCEECRRILVRTPDSGL